MSYSGDKSHIPKIVFSNKKMSKNSSRKKNEITEEPEFSVRKLNLHARLGDSVVGRGGPKQMTGGCNTTFILEIDLANLKCHRSY